MAKGILLLFVAIIAIVVVTAAIAWAYTEYKKAQIKTDAELKKKQLERDQALVEEAESEYEDKYS